MIDFISLGLGHTTDCLMVTVEDGGEESKLGDNMAGLVFRFNGSFSPSASLNNTDGLR